MKKIIFLFAFCTSIMATAQNDSNLTNQSNSKMVNKQVIDKSVISAKFPYQSEYANVNGAKIHYIDEGDPNSKHTFILLHGNPTSNYIWRNIVPYLKSHGRVIAPDLIGMGKSDKPDIDYTFQNHIDYMDNFIKQFDLDNIIFVIQDWGSGIGFHFSHRFPDKVSGIVFLEGIVRTIEWSDANLIERFIFKRFRHPKKGYKMIVKKNFFVKKFLPMMTKRKLTKEEKAYYESPYLKEEDRKAVWIWPTQIAIGGQPKTSHDIIKAYENWLPSSDIPKLMFHAKPGVIIKPKEAKKIKDTWKNISTFDLGKGKHYLQETHPHQIGQGISDWYLNTLKNK